MAKYYDKIISFLGLVPVLTGVILILMKMEPEDSLAGEEGCPSGSFILSGMERCRPLLDCANIKEEILMQGIIGQGAVKVVRRGVWQGKDVAVNTLANTEYRQDFTHGLHMLQQLQSTVNVTQLVGVCEEADVFVTEFHPLGSADQLETILAQELYHEFATLSARFSLCEQYVSILHTLHSSPDGARVMCDSNDLKKTLSQFLFREDLSLILNDVDALPVVDKNQGLLIKCGHRELFGDFVAPEQLWPFEDRQFEDSQMPGYDEMVDIWKVPDVCDAFLGQVESSAKLRLQLLSLHLKCKSTNPSDRPSALELVKAYAQIRSKLDL